MKKELDLYDPFKIMKKNFFEDFFEPFEITKGVRTPLVDIIDNGKSIEIKVELPGINKENIIVDAHEDYIKIEAETKEENKEKNKNYYRYEMRSSAFSRTIPMPEKIDSNKVSGELKNGMLVLNAPKIKPVETKTNRIKIK